jgi:hypothetical protein
MLFQFMQHPFESVLPIIFNNFLASLPVFLITGKSFTHTILFWNVNDIKSKKYELINYLEATNIIIALISETHLQTSNCLNFSLLSVVQTGSGVHPSIKWVPGAFSPGVRWPGCEADHSPPTSAGVKKMWIYSSTSPYTFMA